MSSIPKKIAERIKKLERMRQDFVANVSHELRTPLTVIHGYLELLLDGEGSGEQKNIYNEMQQQTIRMRSLIEDLLLLSRLENDELEAAENHSVDVSRLITHICAEAKTLSAGQHILELNIQPGLHLFGSEKELRSLFSNLIFNAVKYTPVDEKSGKISVDWAVKDHHAVFSVSDTGIGIDAEHIPRLTERFYRVDPGRSRASGGTGLGLAIAKHVLIRHKGTLDIQSTYGKGQRLHLYFSGRPVYNHAFYQRISKSPMKVMKVLQRTGLIIASLLLMIHTALAADAFVVKNIQVDGLKGLSKATVLSYLPIKVGQTLHPSDTPKIISALYATGFFSNVSLSQDGDTLVVHVSELPVISNIKVAGNSAITSDEINKVFKELGLVRGQVLDPSVLSEVVKSLRSGYDLQGHYNATVTPEVVSTSRNRVNITINISEGRVALVRSIHVIGTKDFSEGEVINSMELTTWKWDSIITHHNHYSREAFDKSLGDITDFYQNRGYVRFKVDSANAVLSPDRKDVDLVVHVTEGKPYHLSNVNFTGTLILPESTYRNLPAVQALKAGEIASKQKIMAASKAVTYALGDQGYAFAKINVEPAIDDANHTVAITFDIVPGRKVYVRQIHFSGNTASSDTVLRQAMRQSEGALSNIANIDESKRQLNLLGYFTNVMEQAIPVPGSPNEVDLDYKVSEQPSAQATVGAGYGTDGVVLSAGVNENNFLGTGRQVGVNFSRNVYQQNYSFSYNNPYYTPYGVQRGFTLYNTKTMPGNLNLTQYEFSSYGGTMTYSIPFSEKNSYQIGFGLQRTVLAPGNFPSQQILRFVQNEGKTFNQFLITGGWTRNTLNRIFFPTDGTYQNLGIQVSTPLVGKALDYYKATYLIHDYIPIKKFTGFLAGTAGYGGAYGQTKGLPFFTNYYAGGLIGNGEVRGYDTNSLGPKDSTALPIGGNVLLAGTAEILFPYPLSGQSFRTGVFVDAGNVYNTWNVYNTYPSSQTGVKLSDLRYSTGVDIQWKLPVLNAILEVALAKALNPKEGDLVEPFSFNIGGNF